MKLTQDTLWSWPFKVFMHSKFPDLKSHSFIVKSAELLAKNLPSVEGEGLGEDFRITKRGFSNFPNSFSPPSS